MELAVVFVLCGAGIGGHSHASYRQHSGQADICDPFHRFYSKSKVPHSVLEIPLPAVSSDKHKK